MKFFTAIILTALTGYIAGILSFSPWWGFAITSLLVAVLVHQKAGKAFLTLEDGSTILPPAKVAGADHLAALSDDGRLLVFSIDQMKKLSGGKGVQIIGLKGKETLKAAIPVKGSAVCIKGVFRNKAKEILLDEKHLGQRARRGAAVGLVNNPSIAGLPDTAPSAG